MGEIDYHPELPFEYHVSDYFRVCLQERNRQAYEHLRRHRLAPEAMEQAEALARSMLEGIFNLASWKHLVRIREDLETFEPEGQPDASGAGHSAYIECVNVLMAERSIGMLEKAQTRFWHLCRQLAICTELTDVGRGFLEHVSTCYLFGFDTQCNIMCRSVLDTEFSAIVPTDECMSRRPPLKPGEKPKRVGLAERIDVARQMGLISRETQGIADQVVLSGDASADRTPKPTTASLGLIVATLKVLKALDRGRPI